jgi:hypothetical protein
VSVQIPSDAVAAQDGKPNKSWLNMFNKIASILNALGGVGATTSPAATNLATVITLANELKAKIDAINNATK